MKGGSNTYNFSIGTGNGDDDILQCTLIVKRPHDNVLQTKYKYKLTIGEKIYNFQTAEALEVAIKHSRLNVRIQQIISKISSLITQDEDEVSASKSKWWSRRGKTPRDQEHFRGLLQLYNVLYANNLQDTKSHDSPLSIFKASRRSKSRVVNWKPNVGTIPDDDLDHISGQSAKWLIPYTAKAARPKSKPKGGSKHRRSVRRNRSPNKTMKGGSNSYNFTIGDHGDKYTCILVIQRPHNFGRNIYLYNLSITDDKNEIFKSESPQSADRLASSLLLLKNDHTRISQIISELARLIISEDGDSSNSRQTRQSEHSKGLALLHDTLFSKQLHADKNGKETHLRSISEGGSKRRRSVRRNRKQVLTRRLRR
jgi:hypothetical protein